MQLKIHPNARRSIKDIWRYTEKTWGEDQANAYVQGLYQAVYKIADDRRLWRPVPHEHTQNIFFTRYKHHYIFFRALSTGQLGIVSVLHEKMNIPSRLKDDLDQS